MNINEEYSRTTQGTNIHIQYDQMAIIVSQTNEKCICGQKKKKIGDTQKSKTGNGDVNTDQQGEHIQESGQAARGRKGKANCFV